MWIHAESIYAYKYVKTKNNCTRKEKKMTNTSYTVKWIGAWQQANAKKHGGNLNTKHIPTGHTAQYPFQTSYK